MRVFEITRIVISSIYAVLGCTAFVTFLIIINYSSSMWALLTAISSVILTHLHLLSYKGRLQYWYAHKDLTCIGYLAFALFTAATVGLTFHVTIEILAKTPILPVGQSQVIPAVWCFMTIKSSLVLLYYANYYKWENPENSGLLRDEA